MKRFKILYILFLLLAITASCKRDFLDKTPDEDLSIDDVFSQRNYAEQFLTNIYTHLPNESNNRDDWGRDPFVGASDEIEITWLDVYANQMNSGAWNASDERGMWHPVWQGIRKANIFLENAEKIPLSDHLTEEERDHWIGEAHFLRAFLHFLHMRLYGPIPIVSRSLPLNEDFSMIKRQPITECVEFIVNECDQAAALLPIQLANPSLDAGRATRAAALALKARVLLYMASPLWNALNEDGTKDPNLSDFSDKDGAHLFPQSPNADRWHVAADAAKACIDETEAAGYKLYKSSDGDPVNSYQELFLKNNNSEVLFATNIFQAQNFERQASPNGMGGFSGLGVSQELVDAYEMQANGERPILGYHADGSPIINPASGYVETGYASSPHPKLYYRVDTRNMYVGRDPRFYASVNFNGQYWRTRRVEFWKSGLDGVGAGKTDYTKTGYLVKKGSSPAVRIQNNVWDVETWIYFRLGEQYLNYAEARNEDVGPDADVYKYINAIRERAGMPHLPVGLSQETMRERIRHERRIELAFETHRYFDAHRWKIADQTESGEIHGLNVQVGTSLKDDNFYQRRVVEKRVFDNPKHYFWPIPQPEIERNPAFIQNLGW